MSTTIEHSAFADLDRQKRLLNPVFKGEINTQGRFGFRGELAIKFAVALADEARPPELLAQQIISVAEPGAPKIGFFSCYLLSFGYLESLVEVLADSLDPTGKYFIYCNNIDFSKRYHLEYKGIPFYILPLDEATVYNELLDLFGLERNDLKKLDTAGKINRIAESALQYSSVFPEISYADCLAGMGPVRDPGENRPV
ncbi:hypothetical protein Acife_1638 [Acidithiobacillus ferrivorans SS3]|jgi:hypothetical protein|uniref:Uncharacterized protein n=2 Tax=Acidithiobacillus ferrivorans TaxID=160808 RepID=A0A1E7XTX4_9PROT|nr:hypothetical protein [Acidithiobacillus ferrivorans]AEM47771.1 hypothetical protein Acife_1638 [Acidithiobacillus ferrivorans SS3]OFA16563.1 hypothetical protein A4U49_06525 [Acidithiobacillus ferrivorans]QQD74089.1 hypothetical protein H2515_07705 [Acidithiobacillus ferrivorans]